MYWLVSLALTDFGNRCDQRTYLSGNGQQVLAIGVTKEMAPQLPNDGFLVIGVTAEIYR